MGRLKVLTCQMNKPSLVRAHAVCSLTVNQHLIYSITDLLSVDSAQAVRGIHDMKIVHSDLKPANFMLVQGQLKLIDFGIAKSIMGDTTSINRESQVCSFTTALMCSESDADQQ